MSTAECVSFKEAVLVVNALKCLYEVPTTCISLEWSELAAIVGGAQVLQICRDGQLRRMSYLSIPLFPQFFEGTDTASREWVKMIILLLHPYIAASILV